MSKQPEPFIPAPYTESVTAALQALERGEADSGQQQLALAWIINDAAKTYDLEYRTDGRDHAFSSGRRFVGLQIVTALKIKHAAIKAAVARRKTPPTT